MSEPLATPADVADIWRPLSTAQQAQASRLIVKAEAMLRHDVPFNIDDRMALDPADPQYIPAPVVASVLAEMVKRVMVNPNGASSTNSTTGPYASSVTYADSDGGVISDLCVTPDDIAKLRPAVGFELPFTIKTPPRHDCRPPDPQGVTCL